LELSLSTNQLYKLTEKFEFRNDEKKFAKEVLEQKKNLWIFRTNQQKFCGDFIIIDMSSPIPEKRAIFVLDLKQNAQLKQGGGGAGIQFKNAQLAVSELADKRRLIPTNAPYELLSGDRKAILRYLGVHRVF
jgi:hypothetical protein